MSGDDVSRRMRTIEHFLPGRLWASAVTLLSVSVVLEHGENSLGDLVDASANKSALRTSAIRARTSSSAGCCQAPTIRPLGATSTLSLSTSRATSAAPRHRRGGKMPKATGTRCHTPPEEL